MRMRENSSSGGKHVDNEGGHRSPSDASSEHSAAAREYEVKVIQGRVLMVRRPA
ncbi:MAG: hypothetical protein QOD74_2240 [Variibacter sp.]|jgi:hypothetical protein|nr:hypothetical protein [Variibacter sp.]